MAPFKLGDKVIWHHELRGGYGYIIHVPGEVVKITPHRIHIRVPKLGGEYVMRFVLPEYLTLLEPPAPHTAFAADSVYEANCGAEQREEWREYGKREEFLEEPGFGDEWCAPNGESDWHWGGHLTLYFSGFAPTPTAMWFRFPLLSLDYA